MNRSQEQIRMAVEAETLLFCQAKHELQTHGTPVGAVHEDVRLYARETQCGYATAFVQHGLRERHGIETERLVGQPPLAPHDAYGRRLQHVVLQHEDTLIDPTYGQFLQYAGVKATSPQVTAADYPERLALLVDTQAPDATFDELSETLQLAADGERLHVATAPFRGLGAAAIRQVVADIYNPAHYQAYPTQPAHPSFAYTQRLIDMGDTL